MKVTLHEKGTITGELVISVYNTMTAKGHALEQEILALIDGPRFAGYREKYLSLVKEMRDLFLVREYKVTNLIATEGRAVIAQRLANDTTYTGIINYGALGSSATAPTNGDTQLTTEVFRKVVASTSDTTNQAFIDFFYSKTDTDGTYEEFGTFIDGTGSADTGQLFTHALTGGWVKSASESLTVSVTYTVN